MINKLIIWNLNTFTIIKKKKKINNIHPCIMNGIKELPNERIIISEDKTLNVINYMTGEIVTKIKTDVNGYCFEIINKILSVGYFDGSYLEINLTDYSIKTRKEKEISIYFKYVNFIK